MRRAHAHVNRNVHSAVRPHAQSCTTQTKPSGQRQARKSLVTCPPHTGRPEPRVAWSCPRERGIPGQAPTPRVVVRLIACRAPCRREPSLHRCPERGLRRPPHTSGNHPETLLAGKARPGEGRRLPRMRRGASFGDSLVSIFALRLSTARKECGGRAGGSGERPGRRSCAHSAGTLVSPGGQKQRPAAELSRRTKLGGEEEDAGCGSRRTKSGLAARRPGPEARLGQEAAGGQARSGVAWLSGNQGPQCKRPGLQRGSVAELVPEWPPRAAGHPELLLTSRLGSLADEASAGLAAEGRAGQRGTRPCPPPAGPGGPPVAGAAVRTASWAGGRGVRAGVSPPLPALPLPPRGARRRGRGLLPPLNGWGSRLAPRSRPPSGVRLAAAGAGDSGGLTFLADLVVQRDGAAAPLDGPVHLFLRARVQGDTLPLASDAAL